MEQGHYDVLGLRHAPASIVSNLEGRKQMGGGGRNKGITLNCIFQFMFLEILFDQG